MSFSVNLSRSVRRKIQAWDLSGRLQREILERLYEELAESPSRHLRRLPAPADIWEYSVVVRAEGDPPRDYLFSFAVRYFADEETLLIHDCDYLSDEPGPG